MSVQELVEAAKALHPKDQQYLRQALEDMRTPPKESTQIETFHQSLLAADLVKSIKRHNVTHTTERRMIQVKGKPLSETILEERR